MLDFGRAPLCYSSFTRNHAPLSTSPLDHQPLKAANPAEPVSDVGEGAVIFTKMAIESHQPVEVTAH